MSRTILAALLLALTVPATAKDTPENIVKYRHNAMEAMGKHMRTAAMIVKGEIDLKADLGWHAHALHGSSMNMTAWFPDGTGPDMLPSDSKPEVWSDKDGFAKAVEAFQKETATLVKIADAQPFDYNAYQLQFMAVGKSCGGCHDGYRVEEEE